MVNIQDITYEPTIDELKKYIDLPLFNEFFDTIQSTYNPKILIQYSKDTYAMGWNIKCRKSSKALCAIYPRKNHFIVLVVIGRKEKPHLEKIWNDLSQEMQTLYQSTREGNDQRWLMIEIHQANEMYQDLLKLIQLRTLK